MATLHTPSTVDGNSLPDFDKLKVSEDTAAMADIGNRDVAVKDLRKHDAKFDKWQRQRHARIRRHDEANKAFDRKSDEWDLMEKMQQDEHEHMETVEAEERERVEKLKAEERERMDVLEGWTSRFSPKSIEQLRTPTSATVASSSRCWRSGVSTNARSKSVSGN